jgi:predicted HAD superfamily Cof-like phosphohydrolase
VIDVRRDLIKFHRHFGCTIGESPAIPDDVTVELRCKLIDEEYRELMDAIDRDDLPAIAKEAIDLIYVVGGTLVAYGIDPVPVWRAVHESNMTKDGTKRADMKILKGDGYRPPEIAKLVGMQGSTASFSEVQP